MSSEQMTTDTAAVDDVQNDVKAEDVKITDPPETSTPPSSPPLALNMAGQKHKEMPPPSAPASASRKRSHDDMYGESQSADIAPPASQGMDDDSVNSQTIKKSESQQSQEQQRAAKDALVNTTSQSEQLPPSGQGSQKPKSKSGKSTKTPKMAVENDATTEDEDVNSDDSESADQTEPQDQIENFDWRDLEVRYHNKMQEFDQKERAILDEFIRLVHYFNIWAQIGGKKEVDRSFKRLKTQMAYVNHEEDELEQKRQHYIKVVDAFKSALELLNR